MKKKWLVLFVLFLPFTMIGCTKESNKEVEALKNEVDSLKSSNASLTEQVKRIDLKLSGEFTVTIQTLVKEEPFSESKTLAVANFYQSSAFILPVGKDDASKLKEGKVYTFKLLDSTIKDILYQDYKNGSYSIESFFDKETVKYQLVGEAKEDELGMNSYRIKIEEVEKQK